MQCNMNAPINFGFAAKILPPCALWFQARLYEAVVMSPIAADKDLQKEQKNLT